MSEKRDVQNIISWIEKKNPQPWEILFLVTTEYIELVDIKINKLLTIKWGRREKLRYVLFTLLGRVA